MRRLFFLATTILLIELFTYIGAKGIFWLIKPYLPNAKTAVFAGMFVITHLFLVTLFVGMFRFGMGYMAVLWLGVLSIIMTTLLVFAIKHIPSFGAIMGGVDGVMVRVFGVASFLGLVGLSVYNAYTPVVRHLSIQIDKPMNPVRVAVASDTHLGYLVGSRQLNRLADILRREKADMLLMPGDIMDDDTHVYHGEKMHTAFDNLVASVNGNLIASLGNHDLYNAKERHAIVQAVRDSGAILLDDTAQTFVINGTPMTIIGRYDDHYADRLPTHELIHGVDTRHPVILLDHRPSQIDQNTELPIDLQVSGHTHNGQVFPANFIVKAINRVAYGHEKINGTHVVVSSGYGFWGVPFRLGSQAEVWVIDMRGK
ncbi:metallophosphoesterase [Moraxella lacunata]|uniref:metallophosphoesterase n=1 Tax=Moraxella lacunata TaxID=477 RepID=UPI0024AE62AF|nr:metallophosphoesterase [Moraxella lacunata]MDI4507627.1 metallophosphoesterase [Moraxella lacunata]